MLDSASGAPQRGSRDLAAELWQESPRNSRDLGAELWQEGRSTVAQSPGQACIVLYTVWHGFLCYQRMARRILQFWDHFCSTGLLGVDLRGAKNIAIYMVWGQKAVAQCVFETVLEGPTPHCILHFVKCILGPCV